MGHFVENRSIFCNLDGPRRAVLHSGPRGVAKTQNRAVSREVSQKSAKLQDVPSETLTFSALLA